MRHRVDWWLLKGDRVFLEYGEAVPGCRLIRSGVHRRTMSMSDFAPGVLVGVVARPSDPMRVVFVYVGPDMENPPMGQMGQRVKSL